LILADIFYSIFVLPSFVLNSHNQYTAAPIRLA